MLAAALVISTPRPRAWLVREARGRLWGGSPVVLLVVVVFSLDEVLTAPPHSPNVLPVQEPLRRMLLDLPPRASNGQVREHRPKSLHGSLPARSRGRYERRYRAAAWHSVRSSMEVGMPVSVPEEVVVQLEEGVHHLIQVTVDRVLQELASYSPVKPSALEVSVRRNLAIAIRALRSGRPPEPVTLVEAEQTTRERFAQGIPVEEIIRAFRISIGLIQERFVSICFEHGAEANVALAGSGLLWAVGDAFTTRVVTAYHALDLDSSLEDAQRRAEQVRAMLDGTLNMAESADDLKKYRLYARGDYAAIRCVTESGAAEKTRREIERSGSLSDRPALIAVDRGECLGVVATRPTLESQLVLGIGPFVALGEVAHSFRVASKSYDVAKKLYRRGVFGIEELSWRLAAVSEPNVTEFLYRRYVAPLRAQGEFGAVLETTLRAYFEHRQSMTRTAEFLVLHVNTLRYRLKRIAELTSTSLESVDALVELAWALELSRLEDW